MQVDWLRARLSAGEYDLALVGCLEAFFDTQVRHYKGRSNYDYALVLAKAITGGRHANTVLEAQKALQWHRGGPRGPSRTTFFRRLEHITNQRAKDATLPATLTIALDYADQHGFDSVELCLDETDFPSTAKRRRPGEDFKATQVGALTKLSKNGHHLEPRGNTRDKLHPFLDGILYGIEYLALVARFPDGAKFPLFMVFVDPIRHPTVAALTTECIPVFRFLLEQGLKVRFLADRRWDAADSWNILDQELPQGEWITPARIARGSRKARVAAGAGLRAHWRQDAGPDSILDACEEQWRHARPIPGRPGHWIATRTCPVRINDPTPRHVIIHYWIPRKLVRVGSVVELWTDAKAMPYVVSHACSHEEALVLLENYRHRWDGAEQGIRSIKQVHPRASGPRMRVRLASASAACIVACLSTYLVRAPSSRFAFGNHAITAFSSAAQIREQSTQLAQFQFH